MDGSERRGSVATASLKPLSCSPSAVHSSPSESATTSIGGARDAQGRLHLSGHVPSWAAPALDDIPLVILGAYLIDRCARDAGMAHVGFQTVTRIFRDFAPLLQVPSWLDFVMTWREGVLVDMPSFGDVRQQRAYLRVVRSLLPRPRRRLPRLLGEVLEDELGIHEALDRIVFLKQLAAQLAGRLRRPTELRDDTQQIGVVQRTRIALQWVTIAALSESTLQAV